MRLPSPSYGEYIKVVATVLGTVTLLQYVGVVGPSGDVDGTFLAVLGITLPVFIYLLTAAGENTDRVSEYDRMVHTVGCNYFKIFATPMVADSSQTYSRQYQNDE